VPDMVSALFVEAITWWLEQGRPYTPREIATRSARLAQALFKEASTNTFRISDEAASVAYFRAPTLKDCRQEPPHGIHDTRD
jgi:hypothetical protein